VEIEFDGKTHSICYDKVVRNGQRVDVAKIRYTKASGFKAGGFEIIDSLPTSLSSKQIWGLDTQVFHKVNAVLLSPNFWDERAVGNKHFMFMLDKCVSDESARGFYNEFLKSELEPHRKVFEVLGSKMKVEPSNDQLSGLGFSSTQRNTLVCRVKGSINRTIKVNF
jgi:hypothetical protein